MNTHRLENLEARFEQWLPFVRQLIAQVANLANQLQQVQGQTGGGVNPGSGNGAVFWASNRSGAVSAATGSWPTLPPSTFTSDIYVDLAGTLTLVASSQTVRWFYKDSAAANSLIPVEPTDNGTAWDAIANSCTAV